MVEIDDKINDFEKLKNQINNQLMRLKLRKTRINYRINRAKKIRQQLAEEEAQDENKLT